MNEHVCTVCFRPGDDHPEVAEDGRAYWPPLCCPGCGCREDETQ